jgi:adenine-specific DNA-methyltransferase
MSIPFARANRRRMTDAEMRLWHRLRPMRAHGLAFRRQSPIGRYIIDFECWRAPLCVELDGAQHNMTNALAYDAERTAWLESRGNLVLRFTNLETLHRTDDVVGQILDLARGRVKARYG